MNLELLRLPEWYDVDTAEDLQRLRDELASNESARRRAPETCARLLGTSPR
jgi:choline kinase